MVLNKTKCLLCTNKARPLFTFSNNPEKALIWLQAMGKESLLEEYEMTYIMNNGRICKNHFEDWCFTNSLQLRLNKCAVPCQQAPSTPVIIPIPSNSSGNGICESMEVCVEPEPSTSNSSALDSVPSTPKSDLVPKKRVRVPRTPKTKRIAQLVAKNYALQRKVKVLQERAVLTKLKDLLTPIQFEFVKFQIKEAKLTDRRGHRWSPKAKALAMNVYLKSPSAYRVLRKHFAFPSVSTLRRSTGNIAKYDGFCPLVQKVLTEKAKKMKDQEKYCSLVFDEMHIKTSLTYNASTDGVDGFETCIRENGESVLATQGLLFMIRGLSRNWKQAIAYYFRGSTTPVTWFRETFFDVIRKVHDCGLTIIDAVCDQGMKRKLKHVADIDDD